jgi:hypothetical protein
MSLAETIPYIGPLLADPQFRWWLLCVIVAIGPVPEDVPRPAGEKGEMLTRWKMGGLLRVLMTAAASHARLADRVGQLEDAFERFGKDFSEKMGSFTTELRALRESRAVTFAPVAAADGHIGGGVISSAAAAASCDAIPGARQSVAGSRVQV